MVSFLFVLYSPAAHAKDAVVYAEGAYTDHDVQVKVYVDTVMPLRSFGFRLVFNPDQFSLNNEKTSRNHEEWYIGEKGSGFDYALPQVEGDAVLVLGGKLDVEDTSAGVTGKRVLLADIRLNRINDSSAKPFLQLKLAKEGEYQNFYATFGEALDETDVSFNPVFIFERGDANADNKINVLDIRELRKRIGTEDPPVYCDCNNDGELNVLDIRCLRLKI
jgi:hypothetical protein